MPTEVLRRRILESALHVFARNGFDGASLTEIAALAQTRHPLVIYHFQSKEELWRQVMAHIFEELQANYAAIAQVSQDMPPMDALKLFVRAFAQFSARHPDRITLVLNEMRNDTDRLRWLTETYMLPAHRKLDELVERVQAEGLIKPIPKPHLAHIIIGAASTIFLAAPLVKTVYDLDSLTPQSVSTHTDWLLDVLFNGLLIDPERT